MGLGEKIKYYLQILNSRYTEEATQRRIIKIVHELHRINEYLPLEGAIVVEIGTGWYPICAVLFYMMGVKKCITYDHVRHVRLGPTKMLVKCIERRLGEISTIASIPLSVLEKRLAELKKAATLKEILSRANVIYHAPGDASETGLENDSVDVVFSLGVLEHIPKESIYDLATESKRILKESGVAYHEIGLHDHYVAFDKKITKVNFLKYSESLWSRIAHNKIYYHNRLREQQFLAIFEDLGGKVVSLENDTDPNDIEVLRKMKIDRSFQGMSLEELAVYQTVLIISFSG